MERGARSSLGLRRCALSARVAVACQWGSWLSGVLVCDRVGVILDATVLRVLCNSLLSASTVTRNLTQSVGIPPKCAGTLHHANADALSPMSANFFGLLRLPSDSAHCRQIDRRSLGTASALATMYIAIREPRLPQGRSRTSLKGRTRKTTTRHIYSPYFRYY
jgi:hypothetical protein